jgi:hypothetical protein
MDNSEIAAIIITIVVIVGLGLYLGGVFNSEENNNLENNTTDEVPVVNNSTVESATGSLKIKIEYDGEFTGGYGSDNQNDDFTNRGSKVINLGEDATYVNVGAKKSDGGSGLLTLSILKGDSVVAEKNTTVPYGEIKIDYSS